MSLRNRKRILNLKNTKNKKIPFAVILGVRVSAVTKEQNLAWIEKWVKKGEKKMVVTPNPEQMMLAQKDRSFRKNLNKASLALCDGEGLLWASRFLEKQPVVPERVTGEEVMQELVRIAGEKGWKVMLVGGRPGVASNAAGLLKSQKSPKSFATGQAKVPQGRARGKSQILGIEGIRNIRNFSQDENDKLIKEINRFEPHLLFIAFGAPWQEKWLAKNLGKLEVHVAMVVGGAFDMIIDPTLRSPKFMSRLGLDWFYRLLRQPWRIRRQLALVEFVWLVLRARFNLD
jgi:N-acetylglucosaminyldiphosphoundecaprenol N-acetyl-beta-D-mannosaminyltransferase